MSTDPTVSLARLLEELRLRSDSSASMASLARLLEDLRLRSDSGVVEASRKRRRREQSPDYQFVYLDPPDSPPNPHTGIFRPYSVGRSFGVRNPAYRADTGEAHSVARFIFWYLRGAIEEAEVEQIRKESDGLPPPDEAVTLQLNPATRRETWAYSATAYYAAMGHHPVRWLAEIEPGAVVLNKFVPSANRQDLLDSLGAPVALELLARMASKQAIHNEEQNPIVELEPLTEEQATLNCEVGSRPIKLVTPEPSRSVPVPAEASLDRSWASSTMPKGELTSVLLTRRCEEWTEWRLNTMCDAHFDPYSVITVTGRAAIIYLKAVGRSIRLSPGDVFGLLASEYEHRLVWEGTPDEDGEPEGFIHECFTAAGSVVR
ncbi:hypothetical protein Q8F55_003203 [Vanrija albida]|uniref:Uncharacterized protein n=1 Tax=Vanrija albida TaxID=181172 RepID=A0ABR3QBT8_9TREE